MSDKSPLHEKLIAAKAVFDDTVPGHRPAHFGNPEAEYRAAHNGAVVFDQSLRAKVQLAGPETIFFLQNLCTNNIKDLTAGNGCESFLTTAKARIVAHLYINRVAPEKEQSLLLDATAGLNDAIVKHLDHYLISEQVVIEDRTAEIASLHVCGPHARLRLDAALKTTLPELESLQCADVALPSGEICRVRRNDYLHLPGFDLFVPTQRAATLWDLLVTANIQPAGSVAHEILRIESGFPAHGIEIDENRLAMEVGRTAQAISYAKGCYLGQETIVMARDRGHVNRTLCGLTLKGELPAPGAKISRDGKEVGVITSVVQSPRFGNVALAYLQRGHQTPGTKVDVDAVKGIVTALPFAEVP